MKKGLTLLEVIFAISLIFLLMSSIVFVYIVVLKGWSHTGERSDLQSQLSFSLERIVEDVRRANALSVSTHALRFTRYESGADQSYIYYLYNASDTWPPNYNQTAYELRRAALTGGIGGTFTYGGGDIIQTGIDSPQGAKTSITASGNYALVSLKATGAAETFQVRGYVRPRNIL